MTTLAELRDRLSALPDKKKKAQLGERFAIHLQQVKAAREKAANALASSTLANEVLPSKGYSEVQSRVRKAAKQAGRLAKDLEANPEKVSDDSIESRFALLGEHATGSIDQCRTVWKREVESKIGNWATLATSIRRFLPKEGGQLERAVSSLRATADSPPSSQKSVQQLTRDLKELTELVGELGLEGAFGAFLRSAADTGAEAKTLLNPEIQKKLDELKLWGVFRVRLS